MVQRPTQMRSAPAGTGSARPGAAAAALATLLSLCAACSDDPAGTAGGGALPLDAASDATGPLFADTTAADLGTPADAATAADAPVPDAAP